MRGLVEVREAGDETVQEKKIERLEGGLARQVRE